MKRHPRLKTLKLKLKDRKYTIEYFVRKGDTNEAILFVHGLGGAKDNFWDACKSAALSRYTLISFDNPGTGNSTYYDDLALNIDDLVDVTFKFIDKLKLNNFFLAGASMGGLITLLYLERNKKHKVKGYINIEGNLMPEDCMFSSKVITHSYEAFVGSVFQQTIADMKAKGNTGYHIIANNLELNTDVRSYYYYSFQTVMYSSDGGLLDQYLTMNIPRIFIYGDANQSLSYLPVLQSHNMQLAMIPGSDHFVFYDNPKAMYDVIANFVESTISV